LSLVFGSRRLRDHGDIFRTNPRQDRQEELIGDSHNPYRVPTHPANLHTHLAKKRDLNLV